MDSDMETEMIAQSPSSVATPLALPIVSLPEVPQTPMLYAAQFPPSRSMKNDNSMDYPVQPNLFFFNNAPQAGWDEFLY
jgi:hypothetical protein